MKMSRKILRFKYNQKIFFEIFFSLGIFLTDSGTVFSGLTQTNCRQITGFSCEN